MSPDISSAGFLGQSGRGRFTLALFAFIFFARAWLIKVWGGPMPYWDEWDATALGLFRPWHEGTLLWTDIFAAHNEHRIVLTRLADLALFSVGGRWNPWWQLMLNSALHAATAVALLSLLWRFLEHSSRVIMTFSLALLFSMTNGWQNALWGFQSQFYFCNLLSVLALGGLLLGPSLRTAWWLGYCAALLALFSVGSGVLPAIAAFSLSGLFLLNDLTARRATITWLAVTPLLLLLGIIILGALLRVEVPGHAYLRAHSLPQFCAVFFRCLSWPWVDFPWFFLALQAPWLWLAIRTVCQRTPANAYERFLLGLGGLVILHAAAVAYSRGNGLPDSRPFSRYQDPMLLSTIANLFILLKLAVNHRTGRTAALIWTGLLLSGLLTLTTFDLTTHLVIKRAQQASGLEQVRTYLTTHDAQALRPEIEVFRLYPDPAVVQRVLDDPILLEKLPREFFDTKVRPPWMIEYSPWLTLLSAGWLIFIAIKCGRPVKPEQV